MSSFMKTTKHPHTGGWERAEWLDDFYGHHHYGVRFSSGEVFDPYLHEMPTREDKGGVQVVPPPASNEAEELLSEKNMSLKRRILMDMIGGILIARVEHSSVDGWKMYIDLCLDQLEASVYVPFAHQEYERGYKKAYAEIVQAVKDGKLEVTLIAPTERTI